MRHFVMMYDTEDFDQIQTAEFREAFNEFDKVCVKLFMRKVCGLIKGHTMKAMEFENIQYKS